MKKLIRILRRVRIKFCRSSRRTKTAVVCMVALSMAALMALSLAIDAAKAQKEADRNEAVRLEYENSQLENKIENAGSEEFNEEAARDEDYANEGDIVIEIK